MPQTDPIALAGHTAIAVGALADVVQPTIIMARAMAFIMPGMTIPISTIPTIVITVTVILGIVDNSTGKEFSAGAWSKGFRCHIWSLL